MTNIKSESANILSSRQLAILEAILAETTANYRVVDAEQFRAQHDDDIADIDYLESNQLIQRRNDKYLVSLIAIGMIKAQSKAAARVYQICSQAYAVIRQYYKEDTKQAWKLPTLRKDANLSEIDGVLALSYLMQTTIWALSTENVADPNAVFKAGDGILRYKTFDELMHQTREWWDASHVTRSALRQAVDGTREAQPTGSTNEKETNKDDIVALLEALQEGVTTHATGGRWDDTEYRRVRRVILEHPILSQIVPEFIKKNRNLGEFWSYIKGKFKTYQERRQFISDSLYPLFDKLEQHTSVDLSSYERHELLGQGGFGQVYRYRSSLLNMDFALKIFSPVFREGQDNYLERFFREAKILFGLNHRNIIRVFDIGMIEGRPFIRMEYFQGRNLNEVLKQYSRISPTKALRLVREITQALDHAYGSLRVVHRDLKPSNILVARNQFRVIDFGLGAFVEHEITSRLTRTGEGVAGGYYTAPELLANPALLDPRCDMYSLGAIWYTLLFGHPPAGTEIAHTVENMPQLTTGYRNVLMRMLAPLERRHGSYTSLLDDLAELELDFSDSP